LETSSRRVLAVEDSEPFRKFVCSTLGNRPDLQIVGEVMDGLEAVQTAEKLHPDLIVLDIGLRSLNGIEVARRIRKLFPESKVLFVSQESSVDWSKKHFAQAHEAMPSRLMPEATYCPLSRRFVRGGGLSVLDWRGTFQSSLPIG
jgi:DNA-binding NarL/FixJ family response regulator